MIVVYDKLKSIISWKIWEFLLLADIARVQCVSTAHCEHASSIQNCIKTKARNKLDTKHHYNKSQSEST